MGGEREDIKCSNKPFGDILKKFLETFLESSCELILPFFNKSPFLPILAHWGRGKIKGASFWCQQISPSSLSFPLESIGL